MIKFLGKAFSSLISIVAFLVLILGPVCGYFYSQKAITTLPEGVEITNPQVFTVIMVVLGLVVAFILDVVVFGLLAQILAIRKDVEAIKEKIEK